MAEQTGVSDEEEDTKADEPDGSRGKTVTRRTANALGSSAE